MMGRNDWRGATVVWSLIACGTACGGNDSAATRAADAAERAATAAEASAAAAQAAALAAQVAAGTAPASGKTPVIATPPGGGTAASIANGGSGAGAPGGGDVLGTGSVPTAGNDTGGTGTEPVALGCVPPLGVTGSPTNIPDAIALMNALPKPTSLSCFLESLDRPLALYMTASSQSLQPSPGPRSPRTFVLRGAFEMSFVFEGNASETLEVAFRPTPRRSIKSEILFPLKQDIDIAHLFDRVLVGSATECGNCHTAEIKEDFDGFPDGAWESAVIDPYAIFNVTLDDLRTENKSCDAAAEPDRCSMLSALLDHGPVQAGELGNAGL